MSVSHNDIIIDDSRPVLLSNVSVGDTVQIFLQYSRVLLERSVFSGVKNLFQLPQFEGLVSLTWTRLTLRNCTFASNQVTSISASESLIVIRGDIRLVDITATSGAGFVLSKDSSIIVSEESKMLFRNNNVANYGAAFYVSRVEILHRSIGIDNMIFPIFIYTEVYGSNCFLITAGSRSVTPIMTFINNTAGMGGDVIYGGLVDTGYDGDWNCLLSFKNLSDMTRQSSEQPFRRITSEPSRVCLCGEEGPDCMIVVDPQDHAVYPGQTLTLPLVVVGQDYGTVSGKVYAQLLNMPSNDVSIPRNQTAQYFDNGGCANFSYVISSDCETCDVVLVLTAQSRVIREEMSTEMNERLRNTWSILLSEPNYNKQAVKYIRQYLYCDYQLGLYRLTDSFKKIQEKTIDGLFTVSDDISSLEGNISSKLRFPKEIYAYPLYINIKLRPCPIGFALFHSKCACADLLRQKVLLQLHAMFRAGPYLATDLIGWECMITTLLLFRITAHSTTARTRVFR